MKKKIALAAAIAALMLAGCGNTDSSNKADNISNAPAAAASQAESTAEGGTAESSGEGDTISDENADASEEGTAEESSAAETESSAEAANDYESLKASIDDSHKFESFGETVTFSALLKEGLANVTGEGTAYALTYANGGAGNLFYDVYYTSDGGKTWEKSEKLFDILNGTLSRAALEDGKLLIIDHAGVSFEEPPAVYIAGFNGTEVTKEEIKGWFEGLDFDKSLPFNAYADYLGGYKLKLTVKQQADASESEEAVFDQGIELDPTTYMPITQDAAE